MKNWIKNILCYAFTIAFGVFLLFQFTIIALYGFIAWEEPNKVILSVEVALCIFMISLGIERIRNKIRQGIPSDHIGRGCSINQATTKKEVN